MSDGQDWIMTSTGRVFYPLAPRVEDIDIKDIAHALGAVNRFNGHTRVPYSVAQHCVLVSNQFDDGPVDVALMALLHDASEAYLCDIPRPLKKTLQFAPYRAAEDRLQAVIFEAFGLSQIAEQLHVMARLKHVDRRMLRTEQAQLMPPPVAGEIRDDVEAFVLSIDPWTARAATLSFLVRFYNLVVKRGMNPAIARNLISGFSA